MTKIVWNNGQGEFDFDYLLNITNQEFVDLVSHSMKSDDDIFELKSVKVSEFQGYVKLVLLFGDVIQVFEYHKTMDRIHVVSIGRSELRWALDVMDGVENE